jgi:hypothetical protein
MVQKYVVELLDDLDGSEATDTVTFALDGVSYAIDLSDGNINKFRSTLEPYVAAARRADSGTKSSGRASRSPSNKKDLSAVREWASKNGYEVSSRGRIPGTVLEAYDAAN